MPSVSIIAYVRSGVRSAHADTQNAVMGDAPSTESKSQKAEVLVSLVLFARFLFSTCYCFFANPQGRMACACGHSSTEGRNGTMSWFQKFYTGSNLLRQWRGQGPAGETAWLLEGFNVLAAEDLGSIPSTHMAVHNCP